MPRATTPINPSTPLVELKELSYQSGEKTILEQINLQLVAGEIVTLIGPNGAGKSTLVKLILELLKPTSGSMYKRAGLRIGYMPQQLTLPSTMPINVEQFLGLTQSGPKAINSALTDCGVAGRQKTSLHHLSGGEMQRVLLARTILQSPELLILDEPAQGVDVQGQQALYHLISNLKQKLNCAVLMVSHDLHLVMASSDRVICLNRHICCSGHPDNVSAHPAYLEIFGEQNDEVAIYTHHHDHQHNLDASCQNPGHHHD